VCGGLRLQAQVRVKRKSAVPRKGVVVRYETQPVRSKSMCTIKVEVTFQKRRYDAMYVEVFMTATVKKKYGTWPLSSGGSEFCSWYKGVGEGRDKPYSKPSTATVTQRAPTPLAVRWKRYCYAQKIVEQAPVVDTTFGIEKQYVQ